MCVVLAVAGLARVGLVGRAGSNWPGVSRRAGLGLAEQARGCAGADMGSMGGMGLQGWHGLDGLTGWRGPGWPGGVVRAYRFGMG